MARIEEGCEVTDQLFHRPLHPFEAAIQVFNGLVQLDGYANELDAGSNLGKLIDANCCTWYVQMLDHRNGRLLDLWQLLWTERRYLFESRV